MTSSSLLSRLRNPKPTDLVEVTFTGTPGAVADLARALATVATITAMRHHASTTGTIRLEATCLRPGGRR